MNKIVTLIKTALVLVTLSVAVNANTYIENEYIKSFTGRTDIPVPVKVETPFIGSNYEGSIIRISFLVGTDGKVENVKIISPVYDEEVKNAIVSSITKWEFKPLIKNGSSVSSIVELPLIVASN